MTRYDDAFPHSFSLILGNIFTNTKKKRNKKDVALARPPGLYYYYYPIRRIIRSNWDELPASFLHVSYSIHCVSGNHLLPLVSTRRRIWASRLEPRGAQSEAVSALGLNLGHMLLSDFFFFFLFFSDHLTVIYLLLLLRAGTVTNLLLQPPPLYRNALSPRSYYIHHRT